MSPSPSPDSRPASGDGAVPAGRHRRPESLADLTGTRSAPPRAQSSWLAEAERLGAYPVVERARPTRRRPAAAGRHSAGVRRAASRPPLTGRHRAPGTLPVESWLLIGDKRRQALLASLVAAALMLVTIPGRQGAVNAVNAATAGALGVHASDKKTRQFAKVPARRPAAAGHVATPPAINGPEGDGVPAARTPVVRPSGQGPARSLRTTGGTTIALTFDDGPDPVETPKILALLDRYRIKATFCLVGQNVEKHPEIVRQIAAAGHALCNHTWNHSLTIGQDQPEQIRADLERTNDAIRAAAPDAEISFFRAPGGNFTDRLVSVAAADGMTSLYWAVDPRDWDHRAGEDDAAHTERVIDEIRTAVRPGSIVLSHDFRQPDTVTAYETLLPWLTAHFTVGLPQRPAPATTPVSTPPTTGPASTPSVPTPTGTPTPTTSASPAPAATAGE